MINQRRLGVHTSIAGGIQLSLQRARELGCSTMQIFSHNPRQWFVRDLHEDSVAQFKKLRREYDIDPVFIHSSYLINLASQDHTILKKSIGLLAREMDLADALGADYVVLHTGSASQDREDDARKRAVEALAAVSRGHIWKSRLLLENTAGEKGDISSRIRDLADIIRGMDKDLIGGLCFDTCHAFASGYNIADAEGLSELIKEVEKHAGIGSVKLIHLNDSKKGLGSRVDRHEHIGQGSIGLEGLRLFLNHPALKSVPLILETPKKEEQDDEINLRAVRGLL
ncbi:MAG: deoxyribonuclease IV [Nitrospirae bacterium]|nr:deoxyribonuclease IV [Nitrospirota bacterium]